MKYQFKFTTTESDLWQLSMYGTYSSLLGTTNIVFTVAMILLAVRFFPDAHILLKAVLVLAISVFPVIQPIMFYARAGKQARSMPKEINLGFDEQGMHVSIGDKKEDIAWNSVKGITKKPTLIVVYSSAQHGYVLNNRVLGEQKKEFYSYVCTKINQKK